MLTHDSCEKAEAEGMSNPPQGEGEEPRLYPGHLATEPTL